jgi:5'-nucleotidase / UDP-sugar diphosphatase
MKKTYKVKAGDTLSSIAKEILGSADRWQELYDANRDIIKDPNTIQVGMTLQLPAENVGGQETSDRHFV